ncbi:ribosome maturation factor RimM [Candidatus Berkiella aquae]|uniref:Ribosome maturation factor RimM n=1 Tax=Candidatus Berkiella aquae TaxID=295108 RepID=A0AAE3HY67_9GAMM|nr:ribosome maturation factor RimM [Candidatus Berkiella aquae]MCS5712433.1 ribosome maturation factor RimM [Candidatus Berkiella aquae]
MRADSLVVIGRLGAPFGVQGWQHVQSFTEPHDNVLNYETLYVQQKDQWVAFRLEEGRRHGQGVVVRLHDVTDCDVAAKLTQCHIAVPRDELPALPADEFYWTDLENLLVVNAQGETLGHIQYLYENAGTDVMVIKNQDKEQQVPFLLHDTVIAVDLEKKQVIVDWEMPAGTERDDD